MNLTLVWILSGLLFAGLLISLGFQPRLLNKILGVMFLFVGVAGLIAGRRRRIRPDRILRRCRGKEGPPPERRSGKEAR